jgi:hypothetical protein
MPENETDWSDEDDEHWGRGLLARWAAELDDPREDIYTAEDGRPYHTALNPRASVVNDSV